MTAKPANSAQRKRWLLILWHGCAVGPSTYCHGRMTIHHCGTGAGGRKDHDKVICLCWGHHLGPEGIDGKKISKRAWQEKYGSEVTLLAKTEKLLSAELSYGT